MKIKLIFLILFLQFNLHVSSQNIEGKTLELKNNEPISGVNIYSIKSGKGTVSDKDGKFILKLNNKSNFIDTIYFSCIGFKTRKIPLKELKKKENIILLSVDIKKIEEIIVLSDRHLQKNISYKKLEPLKYGLYAFGSVIMDNKIWISGGDRSVKIDFALKAFNETGKMASQANFEWLDYSSDLNVFDIDSKKWHEPKTLNTNRAYHNVINYKNTLYIIGGKKLSKNAKFEYLHDEIELYNKQKDNVLVDHTNPHQAANAAIFLYNDNIIIMGGSVKLDINQNKIFTSDIHLYDLKTGLWYKVGDMPVAKETKGILIDEKIYLFGGFNKSALKDIETYDLNTGEWSKIGALSREAERPGIAYNNGVIYIFNYGRIYTLDFKNKQLKEYLIDLDLRYSELYFSNSKLYIFGGYYDYDYSITPSPNLYCIDLTEFEKTQVIHTESVYLQ